MNPPPTLTLSALVLAALLPLTGLRASPTLDVQPAGATTLSLSQDIQVGALALGLTVGTVDGSTTSGGGTKVSFPITGGAIDAATGTGEVIHRGGLFIRDTQGRQVTASALVVDTTGGDGPVLTALITVNGEQLGRVTLVNLVLPADFSLPVRVNGAGQVKIKNIALTLSRDAASALNRALNTAAFTAGFRLGTAKLVAFPGQTL